MPDIQFGKAIQLRAGSDLSILTTGSEVHPTLQAAEALAAEGIYVAVWDVHTIKPLDLDAVALAAGTGAVLTVEEANRTNGLGTAVAEALLEGGLRRQRLGLPARSA